MQPTTHLSDMLYNEEIVGIVLIVQRADYIELRNGSCDKKSRRLDF